MKQIHLGVGNYYGEVVAYEEGGKYFLELDNWNKPEKKEISMELFNAIENEFQPKLSELEAFGSDCVTGKCEI